MNKEHELAIEYSDLETNSAYYSGNFSVEVTDATPEDLNNFIANLPGGYYREPTFMSIYKDGETFGSAYKRFNSLGSNSSDIDPLGYSALKMSLSPKKFFSIIDEKMSYLGINIDLIKSNIDELQKENSDFRLRFKKQVELHRSLFPLYIVLREEGFSHRDLVG